MDARVFDNLTRRLGERVPRRSMAGLVATLLSLLGLASPAAGKGRQQAGRKPGRHHDRDRHRQHARKGNDHRVGDEKKRKKKKKKGKAQPQSPPPPGNASPPPPQSPPQSPPPPGGGDIDSFFNQQVYETCIEKLASIIDDHLDLACADDRCAVEGTEDCIACVQEVFEAYLPDIVACMNLAVVSGDVSARQRTRDGGQALAAAAPPPGKPPIGICDGSKYVFERASVLEAIDKPARDLVIDTAALVVAIRFKAKEVATYIAALKVPSDLKSLHAALGKLDVVESQWGCKRRGISGQCLIENPGPEWRRDDGVCCPLPGAARLCAGTCCYEEFCHSCVNGVCKGCNLDAQYCRESKIRLNPREPIEILLDCAPCEGCRPNVCEQRTDTPATRVPGTPDCAKRICQGPCNPGQACIGGECKTCPVPGRDGKGRNTLADCCVPQTCAELGAQCGTHDDGCGGTVRCGSCASGEVCSSGACIHDVCAGGCSAAHCLTCTSAGCVTTCPSNRGCDGAGACSIDCGEGRWGGTRCCYGAEMCTRHGEEICCDPGALCRNNDEGCCGGRGKTCYWDEMCCSGSCPLTEWSPIFGEYIGHCN